MKKEPSRRDALKTIGVTGAGLLVGGGSLRGIIRGQAAEIIVAGQPVEIAVSSESAITVRLTVRPIVNGRPAGLAVTGAMARHTTEPRSVQSLAASARVRAEDVVVRFTASPPTLHIETAAGVSVQRLTL